jgi:hypothetical protein
LSSLLGDRYTLLIYSKVLLIMKTLTILKRTIGLGVIGSAVLLVPLASQALTVEEVTNTLSIN